VRALWLALAADESLCSVRCRLFHHVALLVPAQSVLEPKAALLSLIRHTGWQITFIIR
jgi:hypothetical protein